MTLIELYHHLGDMLMSGVDKDLTVHDGDFFEIMPPEVCVAEEGEFPEDWNMPEGTKYVRFDKQS